MHAHMDARSLDYSFDLLYSQGISLSHSHSSRGGSADLHVIVLKPGNIGPSLNSHTGSAAELGVPGERCLHRNFLDCEEMNSSLSAAVAAPDVMPSSIWHI